MWLLNPYRFGPSLDPDAAAYITAVETADGQALEAAVRTAINAFVVGCKADGIWTAIKASCIMAGARTLNGALQPLVGTAPTNFNFVEPDYNRKTGLIGDGSTKYLNCNRAGNADPQDNRHCAVFPTQLATVIGTPRLLECGGFTTNGSCGIAESAASNTCIAYNRISQAISNGPRVASRIVGLSRSSGNEYTFARNGSLQLVSSVSTGVSTTNWLTHRESQANSQYSNARIAFYSIGESLGLALLDARVSALINAFAAAIP